MNKEEFKRLLQAESQYIIDNKTAIVQHYITARHRVIIANWLGEVMLQLKYPYEVYWLSINILDRLLAVRQVSRKRLQLVGIASVFIACKLETHTHCIQDLRYCCDFVYKRIEILAMERTVSKNLDYMLWSPTPFHFLETFDSELFAQYADGALLNAKYHHLTMFLCCISTLASDIIKYTPSVIASAAILLARHILKYTPLWTSVHYSYHQIVPCAKSINSVLIDEQQKGHKNAFIRMFSSIRKCNVAELPPVDFIY